LALPVLVVVVEAPDRRLSAKNNEMSSNSVSPVFPF
jgi:hypothetical protein